MNVRGGDRRVRVHNLNVGWVCLPKPTHVADAGKDRPLRDEDPELGLLLPKGFAEDIKRGCYGRVAGLQWGVRVVE